jgi:hypothetical protein
LRRGGGFGNCRFEPPAILGRHRASQVSLVFALGVAVCTWYKQGKIVESRHYFGYDALFVDCRGFGAERLSSEFGKCVGPESQLDVDMSKLGG